jgi:hypothetical protein
MIFINTSVPNGAARISQRFNFPANTTHTFGSLTLDNAASVELGGGSKPDDRLGIHADGQLHFPRA